jgi:membrane protease subunit (stomatin/prohibitin family)
MTTATANAMETAAGNENGAMMGFMGMNMAGNAMGGGFNAAQQFYGMGQQMQQQQAAQQSAPAADSWKCSCGATATGKFCPECGSPKPADADGWTCSCGAVNKGKFCMECGAKKPAGAPLYRCDKCGWEPADPHNPPKFCMECGDPFDDNDAQ